MVGGLMFTILFLFVALDAGNSKAQAPSRIQHRQYISHGYGSDFTFSLPSDEWTPESFVLIALCESWRCPFDIYYVDGVNHRLSAWRMDPTLRRPRRITDSY